MFISDSLEITDSVLVFDEIMEEIETGKYLKPEQTSNTGRPTKIEAVKMWTID